MTAPALTYGGIHRRLRDQRGPARQHRCASSCGRQAHDWSYTGEDPNELTQRFYGRDRRYSSDMAFYAPRCRSCHRLHDESDRWGGQPPPSRRAAAWLIDYLGSHDGPVLTTQIYAAAEQQGYGRPVMAKARRLAGVASTPVTGHGPNRRLWSLPADFRQTARVENSA